MSLDIGAIQSGSGLDIGAIQSTAGGTTTSVAGVSQAITVANASGGAIQSLAGRAVDLTAARAVGVITKSSPGRSDSLSVPRATGAIIGAGGAKSNALSIPRATGTVTKSGPGSAISATTARGGAGAIIPHAGVSTALTAAQATLAAIKAAPGSSAALTAARAVAAKLAAATGRIVCLSSAVSPTGVVIEARAGLSFSLTIVRAVGSGLIPYIWKRELLVEETMRARAAYKIEVFDDEDFELFGTIRNLTTLAGASLQFIGYDSLGNVAWDSNAVPPTATVSITDASKCEYDATRGPTAAGEYRWFIKITNPGQRTAPIWGYCTVTKHNAPIPQDVQDELVFGRLPV